MTSSTRAFFVGVGTTFVILSVGFGGGLMLAKKVMEPTPPAPSRSLADRLPPARVILPTSAEAAAPPELPAAASAPETAPQVLQTQTVQPQPIPTKEVQQAPEKDRQAERAERRKAEAEERERRKRTAERKARREAARMAQQQQQSQQRPGIMAFGGDNEQPSFGSGLFGN
jgi:type IV secretory pathway VirB10-like protein